MVKQSMTSYTLQGLYTYDSNTGANPVFTAGADIIEFKGDPLTDADAFCKYNTTEYTMMILSPKYSNI